VGSVEADDERQIAVADDWQLQRLARSSSTNTAAPCPGDIGGPSEQAYTRPAPGRPASATQYAVDVTVLDHIPGVSDNPCSSVQNTLQFVSDALWCTNKDYVTIVHTGTLAVEGWAVTFGTARRGLGGLGLCTLCLEKGCHFYFCNNFSKFRPILLFLSLLYSQIYC